jgi:hypothetical protein
VSIVRLPNEATPADAVAVALATPPAKVPLFRATATVEPSDVTRLPYWSCTITVTAGPIVAPAVALVGCWPKTTLLAAAGLTAMAPDTAGVTPAASVVNWIVIVSATW